MDVTFAGCGNTVLITTINSRNKISLFADKNFNITKLRKSLERKVQRKLCGTILRIESIDNLIFLI